MPPTVQIQTLHSELGTGLLNKAGSLSPKRRWDITLSPYQRFQCVVLLVVILGVQP